MVEGGKDDERGGQKTPKLFRVLIEKRNILQTPKGKINALTN